MPTKPLCFVLMPFGQKPAGSGRLIDFNRIYETFFCPAIEAAGMEPIRADEERGGGIIHKHMYERLVLCPYAVADLTTANANVFYELGIRHGTKPWSTVSLFESNTRLPFDVRPYRAIPYTLNEQGEITDLNTRIRDLTDMLNYAKEQKSTDSPLFQLLKKADPPNFDKLETEIFSDRVLENKKLKDQLRLARQEEAKEALQKIEREIGDIREKEADVLMDLLLSYRAISAHQAMLDLVDKMDPILADSLMIQEQKAFALNRLGRREEAKNILEEQLKKNGPDSETYGLLGRVYKDWWQDALGAGDAFLAESYLDQAIECYQKGFEADWRDFYPGINAVTLMEVRGRTTEAQRRLMEVVRYAVERKIAAGQPGYWDYATLLEIGLLFKEESTAREAFSKAIRLIDEPWMAQSTAGNLAMIRKARETRGEEGLAWAEEMERYLMR